MSVDFSGGPMREVTAQEDKFLTAQGIYGETKKKT